MHLDAISVARPNFGIRGVLCGEYFVSASATNGSCCAKRRKAKSSNIHDLYTTDVYRMGVRQFQSPVLKNVYFNAAIAGVSDKLHCFNSFR